MLYNQLKKCIDEYTKIKHVCYVDDYGLQITVVVFCGSTLNVYAHIKLGNIR